MNPLLRILDDGLRATRRMIDEALPKFDWGKSTLDAPAIYLLNDTPLKVAAAVKALEALEPQIEDLARDKAAAEADAKHWERLVKDLRTNATVQHNRIVELQTLLKESLHTLERVDLKEGVCCCGDNMQHHESPMSCGHSPVDAGLYYGGQLMDQIRAKLRLASSSLETPQ